MKNIRKSSNTKKLFLAIGGFVVVALLITGTVYALNPSFFGSPNDPANGPTEQEKEEQTKTDSEAKKDFVEATKDQEVPGVDPSTPSSSSSIKLSARQDAGTVTVTSKLEGYSSGTCRLTVTNGTSSISENADIIYQPEYSTCAGFSIVKSRLGPGTWTITLYATPSGGSELTQTITYAVQ